MASFNFLAYDDGTKEINDATSPSLGEGNSSEVGNKMILLPPVQQPFSHVGEILECLPPLSSSILLHSCCAPCSGAMVEFLSKLGFRLTIFFYNPNIHPKKEYEIRKEENKRFAKKLNIKFIDCDYDSDNWFKRAKGMEYDAERGGRCTMCFDMRMERTALYAFENSFDFITTTNATSRWKDKDQVNNSGIKAAAKYNPNVEYFFYDWQVSFEGI